jgi:ketosteroid isomerase-like protein
LDIWPWAGVTVGRIAIAERLERVLDHFEIVEYEGHMTGADETVARGRVWFRLVHRASGHEFDAYVRHEATVRDGVIVHLEAFYDVERLRAFMRLVAAMA